MSRSEWSCIEGVRRAIQRDANRVLTITVDRITQSADPRCRQSRQAPAAAACQTLVNAKHRPKLNNPLHSRSNEGHRVFGMSNLSVNYLTVRSLKRYFAQIQTMGNP